MVCFTVWGLVGLGLGIFVVAYFIGWFHAQYLAKRAFGWWLDRNVGGVVRRVGRGG